MLIFQMKINSKVLCKVTLSLLMGITKYYQRTLSKMFALPSEYFNKEVRYRVQFLQNNISVLNESG